MREKRFISIFAAFAMAFCMAGCNSNDADTGQAEQTSVESQQITTDTDISVETLSESEDILLPDGMTMDDLRNMLIINGKTLTLPTSLNELMALDDKFSYEAEYIDENNWQYNGVQTGFFVDVLYDDVVMFTTAFASDENDVKSILDKDIYSVTFGKNDCKKTDINVSTSCGLNFDSSYNDIKDIFGEPNIYNYADVNKEYEFYDKLYKCNLYFKANFDENNIYVIKMTIISNDVGTGQAEQTSAESQQITTDTDISAETLSEPEDILLPDGMTMDDLRNMLIINGKTLTLPTSLNELMALDDKFSYEAEYIDENNWQYNGVQTGFFVDVLYDDVFIFTTAFASNENNVQSILDKDIYYLSFGKTNCQKANLDVNLSCGLGFGSSFEDIKNVFNEPNVYNYDETDKEYEFHDDEYSCELTFNINATNNYEISFFSIRISIISND